MMLVAANVLFTAPLTLAWLSAWYLLRGLPVDFSAIQVVTLTNVICVVFVTHAYETVFLIRERESDMMRVERLERMRVEGELAALHSQIDPHFLFNSLNTLGHVIARDPVAARDFCDRLAEVYRYVLASRGRQLVSLRKSSTSSPTTTPCSRCASARRSSWWSSRPARAPPTPRRGSRRWRCRPCSRTPSSTTGSITDAPLGMRLTRPAAASRFAHEPRPRSSTRPGTGVGWPTSTSAAAGSPAAASPSSAAAASSR